MRAALLDALTRHRWSFVHAGDELGMGRGGNILYAIRQYGLEAEYQAAKAAGLIKRGKRPRTDAPPAPRFGPLMQCLYRGPEGMVLETSRLLAAWLAATPDAGKRENLTLWADGTGVAIVYLDGHRVADNLPPRQAPAGAEAAAP